MGDSFEQAVEAVDGLHARATALDGVEFAFYVSAIREPKAGLQAVLLGGHAVYAELPCGACLVGRTGSHLCPM